MSFVLSLVIAGCLALMYFNWPYAAYLAWRISGAGYHLLHSHGKKSYADFVGISGTFLSSADEYKKNCLIRIDHDGVAGEFRRDVLFQKLFHVSASAMNIGDKGFYSLARGIFYSIFFRGDPQTGGTMAVKIPEKRIALHRFLLLARLMLCAAFRRPFSGYVVLPKEWSVLDKVFASGALRYASVLIGDKNELAQYPKGEGGRFVPVKVKFER